MMLVGYIFFMIVICLELIGVVMLKVFDGFKKWKLSVLVVIVYFFVFYMLLLILNYIFFSFLYVMWSGVGMVLMVVIGVKWFKEELNVKGFIGIFLLILGVVLFNW